MYLCWISESKQSSAYELADKLKPFDVRHRPMVTGEPSFGNSISITIDPRDFDKVQYVIKHAKWQIHSKSSFNDIIYISITPLKNVKYQHIGDLYHITDRNKLKSIYLNGLQLQSDTPGMSYPHRIYLYPNLQMAAVRFKMASTLRRFANKPSENPILLKINNKSGKYKLFVDPEIHLGMGHDYGSDDVPVYTTKPISPEDITVVNNM